MKSYIVDDRTGEINQLGPYRSQSINSMVRKLLATEFKGYHTDVDIVDEVHAWIVINLPGGARYEYEVGEIDEHGVGVD